MIFMTAWPAIDPPLAESNSNQTQLRPGVIVIARRGEPVRCVTATPLFTQCRAVAAGCRGAAAREARSRARPRDCCSG